MAKKILVNLDFGGNQILNVLAQVLASAPSSPAAGQFYFDSSLSALRVYTGSAWTTLGAGGGSDASTLNGQAPTYYLARTNHTGTQTASTISDFDSQVRANRLDQLAAPTAAVGLNSQKITGLADPTSAQDAATKAYVDAAVTGLDIKGSVRAATTANITLSGTQTIDGVSVIAGDRVLVKDQSTGSQNGIYVAASGAWSRATDADASIEVTAGLYTFVEEGTANGDSGWVLTTNNPITVGTTALSFAQFSGAGQITAGTGLTKSGNTLALDTASGYGARVYATTVGDGSATSIAVTHSLGTRNVRVEVYRNSSPYDTVDVEVQRNSTSQVTLLFATAPATSAYSVLVIG